LTSIRDNQTATPGGRHDNDKKDVRSISIVPTCQEFLSDADPYLPSPIADDQATEASLLDRHFRLLREDILAPSKEAQDDPKKQQRDIFYAAQDQSQQNLGLLLPTAKATDWLARPIRAFCSGSKSLDGSE
jgi:hypothetical protein